MKIVCPDCNATYHIPQEFLPKCETIEFKCEQCSHQIQIARPPMNEKASPSDDKGPQPVKRDVERPVEHDARKVRALKRKIRMYLMGFVPPIAQVIAKAQMVMANPYSGVRELAEVIETDQGITAHALRVANSAYYGLAGKVTSINHAAVLLGNRTLGEIITMAAARGLLGERLKGYGLDSEVLWRHSLAVAVGSRLLAAKKCPDLAQDAFVVGILHDAGMIMLDPHIFEMKGPFDELISDGSHTFLQAERMVLGTDHPEVCAEMFEDWGLPSALLKPLANHHRPTSSGGPLGNVVHVADIMARRCGYGMGVDDMLYTIDNKAVAFLGLQEEELAAYQSEMGESVETIAADSLE